MFHYSVMIHCILLQIEQLIRYFASILINAVI